MRGRATRSIVFLVIALVAWLGANHPPAILPADFLKAFPTTANLLAITSLGASLGAWFGYSWFGAALGLLIAILTWAALSL